MPYRYISLVPGMTTKTSSTQRSDEFITVGAYGHALFGFKLSARAQSQRSVFE